MRRLHPDERRSRPAGSQGPPRPSASERISGHFSCEGHNSNGPKLLLMHRGASGLRRCWRPWAGDRSMQCRWGTIRAGSAAARGSDGLGAFVEEGEVFVVGVELAASPAGYFAEDSCRFKTCDGGVDGRLGKAESGGYRRRAQDDVAGSEVMYAVGWCSAAHEFVAGL